MKSVVNVYFLANDLVQLHTILADGDIWIYGLMIGDLREQSGIKLTDCNDSIITNRKGYKRLKELDYPKNYNLPFVEIDTNVDRALEKGMVRGTAMSLSYMLRGENEKSIWSASGMSIKECINNEVDHFDLEKIIPEFATPEDAEMIAEYNASYYEKGTEQHTEAVNHMDHLSSLHLMVQESKDGDEERDAQASIEEANENYLDYIKGIVAVLLFLLIPLFSSAQTHPHYKSGLGEIKHVSGWNDTPAARCKAITQKGTQCTRAAANGQFCQQHDPQTVKCAGITKAGKRCKLMPIPESNYCRMHQNQHP